MNKLKKAVHIYRNQGLKSLAAKTGRYAGKRLHGAKRRILKRRETVDEKALREEYSFVSNSIFQVTSEDITASQKACVGPTPTIKTATWFIPYYAHFGFNGIQTMFRFIQKLSEEGVLNRIVIYDNPAFQPSQLEAEMQRDFPGITNYEIVVFDEDKEAGIAALPPSDIAFCTFWVSAYLLLRFNQTKRKYYFIQDYEPDFYPAGATSALAQSTYRFGFRGVVNTPGLLAALNQRHGLEGISFIPAVNHALYYPAPKKHNKRTRIFMYARPYNPRNAFNLGIQTVQLLLERYGKKIEIITAGADWDEHMYGLHGKITNLGLLKSLEEVAALYRTCDIGFSYMLTPHTSYQMQEYSASGMATVMNKNEDHGSLNKDGVNCLLAEPSPADMAEKIGRLVDDPHLRKRLVAAAQKELGYTWEQQFDALWNNIRAL
ncbi:MAG TPA: glycosyltransferase [Candidatus Saccharimonadales bacterium]|nr:glycosyltransferase [Candidatus Saccharimonadales bacterium]